jgi:hypothetical protein
MLPLLLATLTLAQAAPPETTIVSGPPAVTTNASPVFAFTSPDPAATFQCSLVDAGAEADFAACTSPFAADSLAAGDYTFTVRAVDATGQPDPTPAAASFAVQLPVSAHLRGSFTHDKKTTGIRSLTVRSVPKRGTVSVTCRGGGCPFHAAKTFKAKRHVATLTSAFKKARMRNHARIEITVSAPDATPKVIRVTFRTPPHNPGVAIRCVPPGGTQPVDCGSTD